MLFQQKDVIAYASLSDVQDTPDPGEGSGQP